MPRDVPILESQHPVSTATKELVTALIVLGDLVGRTVRFDDDSVPRAEEIGNVRTDRFLSAKPHSELALAQQLPQSHLGLSHLLAHC